VSEDEVPGELARAAEDAAELVRFTVPAAQAAAEAGESIRSLALLADEIGAARSALDFQAAQMGGSLSSLADLLQAQTVVPLGSSLADLVQAQIGGSLSLLADSWPAQLTGPLQSLAAFELAHAEVAMQSVLPGIFADYDVQPELGPLVAVADAGAATDAVTVTVHEPARRTPARSPDIVVQALVVLLLIAIDLALLEARLSPEDHQMFSDLIANIGLLLAIASLLRDSRKR
jgi:hypothetical protein